MCIHLLFREWLVFFLSGGTDMYHACPVVRNQEPKKEPKAKAKAKALPQQPEAKQ